MLCVMIVKKHYLLMPITHYTVDAVQKASGPLLIELDKTPGAVLGLTLALARHNNKQCVCIDTITPMSIADR